MIFKDEYVTDKYTHQMKKGVTIMANRQYELNKELAQMLKGGVIMDVTTPEQAKIARQQVHVQLWHWSVFRQISEQQAVYQE